MIWKHGKHAGKIAGSPAGDYWRIKLDGCTMRLHQAVWVYHGGSVEGGFIRMVNGDPKDSRIENLTFEPFQTEGRGGIPEVQSTRKARSAIKARAQAPTDDLDERIREAVKLATSSLRADIKALKAEIESLKADCREPAPSVPDEQPVNQAEPEDNDDPDPW